MVLFIAAGLVAQAFWPFTLFPENQPIRKYLALDLFARAVVIFVLAIAQFARNKTHPTPYRPTDALITSGVYRFTRNPIYIAFLLAVLGTAAAANNAWLVVTAIVLFLLLHFGVVKREERYLLGKFGSPYDTYCRQVRRWP